MFSMQEKVTNNLSLPEADIDSLPGKLVDMQIGIWQAEILGEMLQRQKSHVIFLWTGRLRRALQGGRELCRAD